ncbi:MAG: hypothetical protein Q8M31_23775 [Beijerinckiaceae bacterium]|nr:hypothetical protein [Beijerinckiaceae bacterium]
MAEPDFGRVKRNISRMIQMNAPELDIDSYLAGEGVTAEQLRAAPPLSSYPVGAMGSDGVSGDEIRARNAGNTRPQMRLEDISSAYDMAQGNRPEQKAMAEAYTQRERADSPVMMGISDRVRQVAKGVPVLGGALDEMNAGTASLFGNNYDKALDYERARDRTFEAARPKESTALQIGGGVASAVAGLGPLARLAQGATPATTLVRSAAVGAGIGAPDGFTRGEDGFQNRAMEAGIGGAFGGLAGAVAPMVASGVSSGARKIADTLRTSRDIAATGVSRPAADVINRVMSADEALGPIGSANIARGGQNAMLADAGPSASGLLDTIIQRGGPGASTATRAINERATQASGSVRSTLDNILGTPVGLDTAEDAIRRGSQSSRSSAYKAAYATPVNYADDTGRAIEEMVKGRVLPEHIATANKLMRVKDEKSQQILAKIADDGSVAFERMPDVRQLDYITRAINQSAKSGDGQGALGGQTPLGSAYEGLSRDLRGLLRQNVPAYGKALDTAADPIARREALTFGSDLLSGRITRDEVARTVKGMSQAEIAAAKQGIRSQIDDAMANVSRVMSDPNIDARQATKVLRDLSSDSVRDKVAAVIGKGEAQGLFRQLDEAGRAFELRAATATNSKTFARTAMNEATQQMTAPGPMGLLAEGSPVRAGRKLLQGLLSSGPDAQVARQDKIYGEVAQALTEKRGTDAQKLARDIAVAYARKGHFDKGGRALGLLSAGAVSGAALPAISSQRR